MFCLLTSLHGYQNAAYDPSIRCTNRASFEHILWLRPKINSAMHFVDVFGYICVDHRTQQRPYIHTSWATVLEVYGAFQFNYEPGMGKMGWIPPYDWKRRILLEVILGFISSRGIELLSQMPAHESSSRSMLVEDVVMRGLMLPKVQLIAFVPFVQLLLSIDALSKAILKLQTWSMGMLYGWY